MKFNRTTLRIKWFHRVYDNGLHIYLVRNPRDNWQSKVAHANRIDTYFLAMDLLIASQNREIKCFKKAANKIPLINYSDNDFIKELTFYKTIVTTYSYYDLYYIFYYLWLSAFIENIVNADLIININLLSEDLAYRETVEEQLNDLGICDLQFNDVNIKNYNEYVLPVEDFTNIENDVIELIFQNTSSEDLQTFNERVFRGDVEYFNLPSAKKSTALLKNRMRKVQKVTRHTQHNVIIGKLFNELYSITKKYETLSNEMRTCDNKIKALEAQIEQNMNSRLYKSVNSIMSKVRRLKGKISHSNFDSS
jgi:hypothetical protein